MGNLLFGINNYITEAMDKNALKTMKQVLLKKRGKETISIEQNASEFTSDYIQCLTKETDAHRFIVKDMIGF